MRHCPEGKGVLVDVLGIAQQGLNEISAADVVRQVAEELAAVRIVAQVLDDGAAVGIGMGLAQLVLGGVGKALLEQRPDVRGPDRVHDGLVSQHGVRIAGGREGEEQNEHSRQ